MVFFLILNVINSHNGYSTKTVIAGDVRTPLDRDGPLNHNW